MTQTRRPVRPAQGAPARRPNPPVHASSKGRSSLPRGFWAMVIGGVAVVVLALLAQITWPNGFQLAVRQTDAAAVAELHSGGPIRINELMASNSITLVDDNGETSDWIEIANIGNSTVNLQGYSLSKSDKSSKIFVFPDHPLAAGECVLVYANSTLRNTAGQAFHAPFKLSSAGGTLMLFNAANTAIDTVNFPALSSDVAYIRMDRDTWTSGKMATPGLLNTEENYRLLSEEDSSAGIEVTELMASNTKFALDENGLPQDYFVLHNTTGAEIDLSGWFLSDSMEEPTKWRIPDGVTIAAGEYKLIYASGLDRQKDAAHLHTNFGLSTEGEAVVVSNTSGRIVDKVQYDLIKTDQAWVKQEDGSWAITQTPPIGSR